VLLRLRRWVGDLTEGQTWYTARWWTRDLREDDGGTRAVLGGADGGGSGPAGSDMLMAQSTATGHEEMKLLEPVEAIRIPSGHVQSPASRKTRASRGRRGASAPSHHPSLIDYRSESPVGTNTPAFSHDCQPREHALPRDCPSGDGQFCYEPSHPSTALIHHFTFASKDHLVACGDLPTCLLLLYTNTHCGWPNHLRTRRNL
jgi:hypothetical protein